MGRHPEDATPEEVTVVLREPHLAGETLTSAIAVLDGAVPAKAGPCSRFIDQIGRPLSPVSVARWLTLNDDGSLRSPDRSYYQKIIDLERNGGGSP